MFLYHGSNQAVDSPRLIGQTRGLDFGAGFYVTTNENQAVSFAGIVTDRRKSGTPTVSVYEYDAEIAQNTLNICRFLSADKAWLDFVCANRTKKYSGDEFDIIIGAVANDNVMPAIQAYLSDFVSEEATLITLKTAKLVDQFCLKTEAALKTIKFIRSYSVRGIQHD
jgi:hypothetical protein